MSELFRQVCCLLEINQTHTSGYRAMANGMVERFNASLLNMIVTYVNEEQSNWDVYLPIVTSAYRSSVHETTGTHQTNSCLERGEPTCSFPIRSLIAGVSTRTHIYRLRCQLERENYQKLPVSTHKIKSKFRTTRKGIMTPE